MHINEQIRKKKYIKKVRQIGFTLVEVILTLSIIGIIAAITIPTLFVWTQQNIWAASFKKSFAIISQATVEIMSDHNSSMKNAFEDIPFDGWSDYDKLPLTYAKYIKTVKTCPKWSSLGECWASSFTYLNGLKSVPGYTFDDFTDGGFSGSILVDGTALAFDYIGGANCIDTSYVISGICALIFVDVNGVKKPNTWGKDIYGLFVKEDGVFPMGIEGDENTRDSLTCIQNSPDAKNLGVSCAIKVLKNEH